LLLLFYGPAKLEVVLHLITGFIIASLMGKKSKPKRSPLLNIQGPIKTSHLLPGRVRFYVPSIKKQNQHAEILKEQLPKIKGLDLLTINKLSGSVLITYDATILEPELFVAAIIRLLNLEKELQQQPQPIIRKEMKEMAESLNRAVYEKTGGIIDLWTAVPIVLAALGVKKIITERTVPILPAGLTLLWWSYTILLHNGHLEQQC
jgi:hypothetical protein